MYDLKVWINNVNLDSLFLFIANESENKILDFGYEPIRNLQHGNENGLTSMPNMCVMGTGIFTK